MFTRVAADGDHAALMTSANRSCGSVTSQESPPRAGVIFEPSPLTKESPQKVLKRVSPIGRGFRSRQPF